MQTKKFTWKKVLTVFFYLGAATAALILGSGTAGDKGDVPFNAYFKDKTMRLDYFHSGMAKEEHFAVDRVLSDGPWPGSKTKLMDRLDLGLYQFHVLDKASTVPLYSRGFASVFGEWQTIGEAKKQWGTFHESIRFPWPKKPVKVIIKKRDKENKFVKIWSTEIDPAARSVTPADIVHTEKVFRVMENGPAEAKLDLVILGDGYAVEEMAKFRRDVQRVTDALFSIEPYKSRKMDFNVRAVETPSPVSGVSRPHPGEFKRTPLSVHYSSFDSERYALSYDNRSIRDTASAVPYEFTIILMNERTYGGGGIYKLYVTMAADNAFYKYLAVHELGHHLAALADEYYTSSVSYEMDSKVTVEPWEMNITALLDKNNLKWKNLLEKGTPLPTPWDKEKFDGYSRGIQKERSRLRKAKAKEEVLEELFRKQLKKEKEMIAKMKYKDKTGAFEGAGYMAKGMYRSSVNCVMYTRDLKFCPVCQHAINKVIDQYAR
jgi:hypothetical protein